MTNPPPNWMDEASRLAKLWTEQQQNFMRMVTGNTGAFAPPAGVVAPPAAGIDASLRQAQELWRTSIEKWMAFAPQGLARPGNADDVLKALFDPALWSQAASGLGPLDRAIEHLVEGPSYATLWTLDRKVLKAQQLRAQWARDLAAWQLLMQGAWSEATKRFLHEVNAPDGAPIKSWRELTDLWVDIANATLTETHRTPEFLEAQRRLTRSSTECRLQEREIAEAYCEMHHIPTRTEVDELQRTVYELRRDLRSLQRALRAPEAPMPSKAPAAVKRRRKPRSDAAAAAPSPKR
jgi:polyhydroxyalkanoate synthesis regulator phasin